MRQDYNLTNQILVTFLIAFGLFALVASLATIVNLVLGTVLASYREIGVMKALGFTPLQVVAALVTGMLIPTLIGCALGIPAGTLLSLPLVASAAQALGLPGQTAVSPVADLAALAAIVLAVVVATALTALRAGHMSAVAAIAAGSAPRAGRTSRLGRQLQRLRLPRALSLGAGDAFARPLRSGLTILAVLVGVTTIVFAAGVRESLISATQGTARLSGDVSVQRGNPVSDSRVMAILDSRSETRTVLGLGGGTVVVPGLADPVAGVAYRGDALDLGYSIVLLRGRWFGQTPGEVLLPRAVLDEAHLDVGSSFDGSIDGHQLRLHVVGEIVSTTNLGHEAWFDWSTLVSTEPGAQPGGYAVRLRPGSDAAAYAAAVQAQEPDFLQVNAVQATSNSAYDAMNVITPILAVVLGLIAAVGVSSTLLLSVRERSRDFAILKTVGMSPGQLLAMVLSAAAVLGLIGGLIGIPAGVSTHHTLITALARQAGDDVPAFVFDVLHPVSLYPLGLAGLAIALAGAFLPARRAARSRVTEVLRSE